MVAWSYHSQEQPKWPWSMAQYRGLGLVTGSLGHLKRFIMLALHSSPPMDTTQDTTQVLPAQVPGIQCLDNSTSAFPDSISGSHDCCQCNEFGKGRSGKGFYWLWCEYLFKMCSHLVCTVHLVGRHLVDYIHCAKTLHLQPINSKW